MDLNCPSCKSENTQRLAVIHESGISQINSKTGGVGIGIGRGGLAVGVGKASTAGTSQTAMSQRVAPPQKKRYFKPLFWIFLAFAITSLGVSPIQSNLLSSIVAFSWLGASGAWIYHAVQFNFKTWPELTKKWENTFMCLRCNHQFVVN
jgi:hypothetical protein